MVENNYDILKISDKSSKKEIREAYRKLALKLHTDRGGDDEQFKKIKLAYEDLKIGKKYPDTSEEQKRKAKFYADDSDSGKRRKNLLLSHDIAQEMKVAQEWTAAINRSNITGIRLFGSRELGQIEFERKPTKTLEIKGKFWAGHFKYDNPINMRGSITSPYFSPFEDHKTRIEVTKGNFRLIDSLKNNYDIDGGAKIIVRNGDIDVGNVRGKRQRVQDPEGRVGMSVMKDYFTELNAPNGKIITGNVIDTVKLEADTVIVLNLVDNIKVTGKNILVYGTKVTYDVEFFLKKDGKIRFYDQGSGFDISDDSVVNLENGKNINIRDLKKDDLISLGGKDITYDYIDNRENIKKSSKFSFRKIFHS